MKITLNHDMLTKMIGVAIDCKKQIKIVYTDVEGKQTKRIVEPIKWLTGNGVGILTKCHEREGQYRHFKLQGIERIVITDYDFCWVNETVSVG